MAEFILKSGNNIFKTGANVLMASDALQNPSVDINPATWSYTNEQKIPVIYDSSGRGLNAQQPDVARQATYRTNQINGLPCFETDGADDYYLFPSNISCGTLFVVIAANPAILNNTGNAILGNTLKDWQWASNIEGGRWFQGNNTVNVNSNVALNPYNRMGVNGAELVRPAEIPRTSAFCLLSVDLYTGEHLQSNTHDGNIQERTEFNVIAADNYKGLELFGAYRYARILAYPKRLTALQFNQKRQDLMLEYGII